MRKRPSPSDPRFNQRPEEEFHPPEVPTTPAADARREADELDQAHRADQAVNDGYACLLRRAPRNRRGIPVIPGMLRSDPRHPDYIAYLQEQKDKRKK